MAAGAAQFLARDQAPTVCWIADCISPALELVRARVAQCSRRHGDEDVAAGMAPTLPDAKPNTSELFWALAPHELDTFACGGFIHGDDAITNQSRSVEWKQVGREIELPPVPNARVEVPVERNVRSDAVLAVLIRLAQNC